MAKWQCSKCGHRTETSGDYMPGGGRPCSDGTQYHVWQKVGRFLSNFGSMFRKSK